MTSTETRPTSGSSTVLIGDRSGNRHRGRRVRPTVLAAGGVAVLAAGVVAGHYAWKQPDRAYDGGGTLLKSCTEYTLAKAMHNGDSLPLSVGGLVIPGNTGNVQGEMDAHMIDGSLLLTGDKADAQEFTHDPERIIAPGSSLDLHQGKQTLSLTVSATGEVTAHKTC